ncbi:MAG TPA: hypothetical protein VGL81_12935 [Polyangiaceae bacterium]|jgi:hypothetical protein
MAHPADIAPKTPAAFAGGRLSPEEAERLASTFRPSWELDDAPFTGPGTLSEADLRALQGGGTHADVRPAPQSDGHQKHAYASNGAHAAPPPTQSHEPENSVIIDRTITADAAPAPKAVPAAKPAGATILGMAPPPALQVAPQPAPPAAPAPAPMLARPPTPGRPVAPAFNVSPPVARARPKPVSVDLEESYPKKAKTGLWVGIGVGGMALMGLVAWLAMSSGSGDKAAQLPAPTATKAPDDRLSAIPPPPTTAAAPAPTVDPPPPATTVAAASPPPAATTAAPIPTTPVTALPQAAPPTRAAVVQARPSYGGSTPVARPAGKPKGGQTIVRDVPF